jgi:hypothetical protein
VDGRLKIKSLSDFNEHGDAVLSLIRQDDQQFGIIVRDADLAFFEARIKAVRAKAEENNATDRDSKKALPKG